MSAGIPSLGRARAPDGLLPLRAPPAWSGRHSDGPWQRRSVRAGPPRLSGSLSSAAMAGGPADVRKLFLFTTTQNYFGLRPELWDQPPLNNCPEVNNFLDDGNQMLLRVQRSDAGLAFSNTVGRRPDAQARPPSLTSQVLTPGLKASSASPWSPGSKLSVLGGGVPTGE